MAVSSIVARPSAWLPRIQPEQKWEVPTADASHVGSQDLVWWRSSLNGKPWHYAGRSVCFDGSSKCNVFKKTKIFKGKTNAQPSLAQLRADAKRLRAVADATWAVADAKWLRAVADAKWTAQGCLDGRPSARWLS